ncbi:protein BTG4-like isoform 1-T1 [Syngnathus typhle]
MKEEIAATVFFVGRLVKRYGCLDEDGRERFAAALTSALFESYKNHWHPDVPAKGQAYRCLRMNWLQRQDPVLQKVCARSGVRYEDLGLPRELTVWVDPGEVSCRYGEHSAPFSISVVDGSRHARGQFSRRVHDAVERASLEVPSESSSDEDGNGGGGEEEEEEEEEEERRRSPSALFAEAKSIPTVNNPNSVYRVSQHSSASLLPAPPGRGSPTLGGSRWAGTPSRLSSHFLLSHRSSWRAPKVSIPTGPCSPSPGPAWISTTGSASPAPKTFRISGEEKKFPKKVKGLFVYL